MIEENVFHHPAVLFSRQWVLDWSLSQVSGTATGI